MISPEIIKKIQAIKIRTRQVMNGTLIGGHVTKRKGSGFEFDQIRAYSYGDDIRFMDWSSSARSGKLLVKQYLDEKNRTIILCLDISASTLFAGTEDLVSNVLQQVSAVLAFVCQYEQDNVGLILFSDTVEKFIPPSRGNKHIMYIVETIFAYRSTSKKTDMNVLFRYLLESYTKEAAIVLVSDFITDDFALSLKHLVCRREVVAIRCLDALERNIPQVGYVWAKDPESEEMMLLDGSVELQDKLNLRFEEQNNLFKQSKVDYIDIVTDDSFIQTLILFFKQRMILP